MAIHPVRARGAALAAVLALSTILAGCVSGCAPVEVPTQVRIRLADEEVRTLPILTSGYTRVAGEELPDVHGRLTFTLDVTHEGSTNASLDFQDVDLRGLRLDVRVGETSVPVRIYVQGGSAATSRGANEWNVDGVVSGSNIIVWWTVDRDRVKSPAEIVLPEGASYTADVAFSWIHEGCAARAAGHLKQAFQDFVEASANARTFAPVAPPTLDVRAGGQVGLRSDFRITSGLDVEVKGVTVRAVFLGPAGGASANASANASGSVGGGLAPSDPGTFRGDAGMGADHAARLTPGGAALVLFPSIAATPDSLTPRDTLQVRSVGVDGNEYAASGTLLPMGFTPGGGLFVVHVEIRYQPADATLGVTTDTFAFGVLKG